MPAATGPPCHHEVVQPQRFTGVLVADPRGGAFVSVPFDPDQVWRPKPRHPVAGTIDGRAFRAVIQTRGDQRGFALGPAWLRGCAVAVGDPVTIEMAPEGPQRDDLAEDVRAALEENSQAGAFFDALAQFYRKAYLRWIDGTTRRPDERARRIEEMIRLLTAGHKERPKT